VERVDTARPAAHFLRDQHLDRSQVEDHRPAVRKYLDLPLAGEDRDLPRDPAREVLADRGREAGALVRDDVHAHAPQLRAPVRTHPESAVAIGQQNGSVHAGTEVLDLFQHVRLQVAALVVNAGMTHPFR
jgi:hypothetical protein